MANKQVNLENVVSITVGLREEQLTRLDELASELKVNRNAVLRFAVLWGLSHPPSNVEVATLDQELNSLSGRYISRGFTIYPSEIEFMEKMANKMGITRNKLMNFASLHFQKQIDTKTLNIYEYLVVPEVKNHLRIPRLENFD